MHDQMRRKVMAAVPTSSERALSAADIADAAGLNRRSMGTRLNAIASTQSAGDSLGELHVRTIRYRGSRKNLWWREGVESVAVESENPKPMTLEEIVAAFLSLTMKHPDKQPKRVRDQEANRYTIHGFNRAQETLREALKTHGVTDQVRSLADVREEGQQQPMEGPGGRKLWMVG